MRNKHKKKKKIMLRRGKIKERRCWSRRINSRLFFEEKENHKKSHLISLFDWEQFYKSIKI